MIDIESDRFKRSLVDVVRWCAIRPFASDSSNPMGLDRLRALYSQARDLFDEARSNGKHSRTGETTVWKAAQQILAEILRSIGPIESRFRSTELAPNWQSNDVTTEAGWSNAVAEVVAARSRLLEQRSSAEPPEFVKSGRLLLYFPSENLACGAAHESSGGFYDFDNVPPWDLWVGFADRALVSWVPPRLIVAAQMGIDVNPENCIQWMQQ